jgi:hypothetical protein
VKPEALLSWTPTAPFLFLEARFFCKFLLNQPPPYAEPRSPARSDGLFPCAGRAFARALSLARRTGAAMDQQEKPPPLQKKQREARNSHRPRLSDQSKSPIEIANPQAAVTERRFSAESQRVMSISFGQAWLQLKIV